MDSITIDNRKFYRKLVKIALPIAVQSLIACSLSLIDNLMVGYLGEAELAAVGIGIQVYFIHWMVLFGFNSGGATFMAQFWGVRDTASIKRTIGFAMKVSIATGIVFFAAAAVFPEYIIRLFTTDEKVIEMAVNYVRIASPCFLLLGVTQPFVVALRATQQTRIPLYVSIAVFTTNTALNYLLIFGAFGMPRLETSGAALATVIARLLEMVLILYVVFGKKNIVGGKLHEFRGIGKDYALRVMKNSIPTTLNETLWGLGRAAYMAAVGHLGVTAYAAAQASNTIENLFIMAGFSIGDAALILIGEKLGENKKEESRLIAKKLLKIALVLGATGGVLLILSSKILVGFFGFTPEGTDAAVKILFIYGCFLPVNLYNGAVITGVLRGGGDTAFAAICEIACVWLIGVPLAFIGSYLWNLPVYLLLLVIKTEDVIKFIILTVRHLSGKWANNVIE